MRPSRRLAVLAGKDTTVLTSTEHVYRGALVKSLAIATRNPFIQIYKVCFSKPTEFWWRR